MCAAAKFGFCVQAAQKDRSMGGHTVCGRLVQSRPHPSRLRRATFPKGEGFWMRSSPQSGSLFIAQPSPRGNAKWNEEPSPIPFLPSPWSLVPPPFSPYPSLERKKESQLSLTLGEIRRRPTLPGRFQPSTISVLRLNFCVRDGNRWIPQAIVTGNQTGFGPFRCRLPVTVGSAIERPPDCLWKNSPSSSRRFDRHSASPTSFGSFATQGFDTSCLAPSKPHRLDFSRPSDLDRLPSSFDIPSQISLRFQFQVLVSVRVPPLSLWFTLLLPAPCSLLPLSKIKPSTD